MSDPFLLLNSPAPAFTADVAAQLLDEHYGIRGALEPLSSERDQNFLVTSADGTRHILKIANALEDAAVTDFQTRALRHIAEIDPEFPVPRVVASQSGQSMLDITSPESSRHRVRLLTWIDGTPLQYVDNTDGIARQSGSCLARLAQALGSYLHSASDYPLAWDLRQAAQLKSLLPHVVDAELRTLCAVRIDRFAVAIAPRLAQLRSQVIYNDLNPSNILVDTQDHSRLAGVIDFGDMIHSQLINDVAIAGAYLCRVDNDPFRDVPEFLSAYTAILPLTRAEIELLPDLILTRHLTTVMITHWRASLYPDNRAYILRNEPRARAMLSAVAGLPLSECRDRFLAASRIADGPVE